MAKEIDQGLRKAGISVSTPVLAAICLIFGILLIIFPYLVGYIVGIFLIIQGILLFVNYQESRQATQPQRKPAPPPPPPPTPSQQSEETPPTAPPTETG